MLFLLLLVLVFGVDVLGKILGTLLVLIFYAALAIAIIRALMYCGSHGKWWVFVLIVILLL